MSDTSSDNALTSMFLFCRQPALTGLFRRVMPGHSKATTPASVPLLTPWT